MEMNINTVIHLDVLYNMFIKSDELHLTEVDHTVCATDDQIELHAFLSFHTFKRPGCVF